MKDLVNLGEKVATILTKRKQTIAIAESSTGGLIFFRGLRISAQVS